MRKFTKICLIIAGSLAVALGVLGAFLPILPTTPFLLIAAFCYIRSSRKMYMWLTGHRIFGTYIDNYLNYRAVTISAKITAILFLWASLTLSIILVGREIVTIILILVGTAVTIHLLTLKTMPVSKPFPSEICRGQKETDPA